MFIIYAKINKKKLDNIETKNENLVILANEKFMIYSLINW